MNKILKMKYKLSVITLYLKLFPTSEIWSKRLSVTSQLSPGCLYFD